MQVKAVLFDLFDTLVLVEGGETFYEPALKKLHQTLVKNGVTTDYHTFKQAYFEVRDKLYEQTSKNLEEPHFNIRVQQTLEKLGHKFETGSQIICEASMTFAEEFMRFVRVDPETLSVLRSLQEKYKMAIVSNFALPEALLKMLWEKDLDRYFDAVIVSGAVNKRKPSPEIFRIALRLLDVRANEAVFVGDTPHTDIKGAKNAGMKAVLIERPTAAIDTPKNMLWKPAERASPEPDYTIKELKELVRIITDC